MTQRELAELMNISPNHLSVLERSLKMPRASTIEAFERVVRKEELKGITEKRTHSKKRKLSEDEQHKLDELLTCLDSLEAEKRAETLEEIVRLLKLI